MNKYHDALSRHKDLALEALALFRSYVASDLPRVPGMDTIIRLAWRIECGRDPVSAAAREYLYRWNIALGRPREDHHSCRPWRMFGAPHLLGS